MSIGDLRALLTAEKADSLTAMSSSKLSEERARAMKYYEGNMSEDMPVPTGRSGAVSTDVADTIEGLMPPLMEIFAGGDNVVEFNPVGKEDEEAAAQETDYINHVLMQENSGFMILYAFIKDALLSKTGIVKVWIDEGEEVQRETYYSLDDASYTILAADPEVEIVEHTERDAGGDSGLAGLASGESAGAPAVERVSSVLHDVTVETKRAYKRPKCEAVPPEEFGIARNARSIATTGYAFHATLRREEDMLAEGYDKSQIKAIPSYTGMTNAETQARDTVEERTGSGNDNLNTANRQIQIVEHYVRMDYEGDGKPGLYRVETGGEPGEVLRKKGVEVVVREDQIPFACMTPVPQTHRFFGRSVADLVMDIQRINTALTRAALDNLYLHTYARPIVNEKEAGESTLDDLLTVEHGKPIRTNGPNAITYQEVPDITAPVYQMLQYMDAKREWRTGVSRQGQGVDPNALQNQVATIANQMFNASQARVKMFARIFAETGIKDLFMLLHSVIRKNIPEQRVVRLRNKWVPIDPREWKTRNDMTINVGLGTGSKPEQLAHLNMIIGAQEKAISAGMVTPRNLWNSAAELTRLGGHKNPDRFFTEPGTQPNPQDPGSQPITPPPDPKMAELQMKGQLEERKMAQSAEIEKVQAQADIATQDRKTQSEIFLAEKKFELEKDLKLIDAQLKREQMADERMYRQQEHAANMQQQADQHAANMAITRDKHVVGIGQSQEKHEVGIEQAKEKAAVKPKPKAGK